MIDMIKSLGEKVLKGKMLTFEEALSLGKVSSKEEFDTLFDYADRIRRHFAGNQADLCTIMNVKSGKCSEDCKYCAQSSHYNTGVQEYELLPYEEILERAKFNEEKGVHRFSLVSSGKGIDKNDFPKLLNIYEKLVKDTEIDICASHGLLTKEEALELVKRGVKRYHHNVEIVGNKYKDICTTHTYQDRLDTIRNAQDAGMQVCCGGILGLGESFEDRIRMIFEIREIKADSVPVNVLNPISGTPMEGNEILKDMEILKTMAIFRFVYPETEIRFAGGRMAIKGKSLMGFKGGVNGALTGDFLTTTGTNIEEDINTLKEAGFEL